MTKRRRLRSSGERRETDAPGRLLTVDDLAVLFGVSPWTVRYWRKRGHGPREVRLGPASQRRPRKIRYRREDVAAYLEEQVAPPAPHRRRKRQ
jgi:hypothetical protein